MATIQSAKEKIESMLRTLERAETLREVTVLDLKKDPLARDYAAYPVAVLTPPSLDQSEVLDNRSNVRTYLFSIVVMMKPENFENTIDVENLQETIVNLFDNDPTLSGEADAGVEPGFSRPYPLNYAGKDLVYFEIYLRVKIRKDLSFT